MTTFAEADVALLTMSHSPLLHEADLDPTLRAELETEFDVMRQAATAFNPDLVVVFFPDHYNGFFYDVMPPFCLGVAATSIGDYGSQPGPLRVPADLADHVARRVLAAGLDLPISYAMQVDHGAVQPLELLFGDIGARPVLPVFINSVAEPLGPMARIRHLGEAIGSALAERPERVLLIASGGLSHDPPVPRLENATAAQRAMLMGGGRNLDDQSRQARQQRVIDGARAFAAGDSDLQPLAPDWDQDLMALLAAGDLTSIDDWDVDEMTRLAGHSAHEVRTWVAAYAAMSAYGPYQVRTSYYRAIPELIAGFGLTTVSPRPRAAGADR